MISPTRLPLLQVNRLATKRFSSSKAIEEAIRQGRTNMTYQAQLPPKFFTLFNGFSKKPELWPLAGFCGLWIGLFAWIFYWSMSKMEVQINRSRPHRSIEWEVARDQYVGKAWTMMGKKGTDMEPYKKRISELDSVQDEMMKARAVKEAGMKHHHH